MSIRDDTLSCLALSRLLDAYGASQFKRFSVVLRSSRLLDAYGASRFKRKLSVVLGLGNSFDAYGASRSRKRFLVVTRTRSTRIP